MTLFIIVALCTMSFGLGVALMGIVGGYETRANRIHELECRLSRYEPID